MGERYRLENDQIRIEVDSFGAELKSLVRKDTGVEYMWNADAKYWGRTSPVLFPFVGSVSQGKYCAKGQEYPMGQHGFARDMEFALERKAEEEIWFVLESCEKTLEKYPYCFKLHIGCRIDGGRVEVLWRVENTGDEVLPFSIGGHPAFNCPIDPMEKQTDYFIRFADADAVVSHRIENGLAVEAYDTYPLVENCLTVGEHLFDRDALVIEDQKIRRISLCRPDRSAYLTVEMDAPLFGIWSPVGKQAPFVCIEPWYGRCDAEGFCGELDQREWGNLLEPGKIWERSYTVAV